MRGALCVVAAAAAAAVSIGAGGAAAATAGCAGQTYEQPFTRWLDPMSYVLVPGGTFESSLAGWTLSSGAQVVSGNEPYAVHGTGETHSLSLPAGSSATTPPVCVTLTHPTIRFFARNQGAALSTLSVSIVFPLLGGGTGTLPLGTIAGGSSWQPTLPLPLLFNSLALVAHDGTIPVSFVFRPLLGGGAWQIDDVYVDPYCSR